MKSFWKIMLFVIIVLMGSPSQEFVKAEEDDFNRKYKGEIAVAKAIDELIRASRAEYTQNVVEKLKNDGTGAAINYQKQKGFIPLPAQHIRSIASAVNQKKNKKSFFSFFLRSRWNLNYEQGLKDNFEREGWENILRQQKEALKAGVSLKAIQWTPYFRVEDINGQKMLRYLSADPASSISCITCHNNWEQKPEIKALRKKQGVEVGKIFKMHELMGALVINVNVNEMQ